MEIKYIQIIVLAVVFGLQYLVEHLFPQQKNYNDWKNEKFNIAIGILNIFLVMLPAYLLIEWLDFINRKQFGLFNLVNIPSWMKMVFVIFILDAWMYIWHRLNHQVNFFWRFHRFHHEDKKMNSTTAFRFHFIELFFSYPGKAFICFIFGIEYLPLLVYELVFFTAVMIHHSNMFISERKDNIYRTLFASPMMHRIHHSKKWKETNSNFGSVFSFWDLLFNSAIKKAEGEIEFGVSSKE